jgi:methyl-accepting chemotaxis protein
VIDNTSTCEENVRSMTAQTAYALRASIKKRLVVIVGVMGLLIIATGVYGLIHLAEANRRTAEGLTQGRLLLHAVDAARLAKVSFRKQSQEWKNLLLREREADSYKTHLAAFEQQERLVGEHLDRMEGGVIALSLDPSAVDELRTSHTTLGQRYRQALARSERRTAGDAMAVDRLVEESDRDLADRMDHFVEQIEQQVSRLFQQREKESMEQREEDRRFSQGLLIMVVVALGVGIVLSRTIIRDLDRED